MTLNVVINYIRYFEFQRDYSLSVILKKKKQYILQSHS